MAITSYFTTKTHNRAILNVVGTASSDTVTIPLKTDLTIAATGDITFNNVTKTIVRTSGSWTSEGVVANAVVVVDGVHYSVASVTSATELVVAPKYTLTTGTITPVSVTGYTSPFLVPGQTIVATPKVGITQVAYSVSSAGDVTVVRDGTTVFKLFGHDTLTYGSNEKITHPFVVTFNTSAGGTILLELSKTDGFGPVNPPEIGY
jgi:hypothetical protein